MSKRLIDFTREDNDFERALRESYFEAEAAAAAAASAGAEEERQLARVLEESRLAAAARAEEERQLARALELSLAKSRLAAAARAEEERQLARALELSLAKPQLAAAAGAEEERQLDKELLNAGIEASLNQGSSQRLYDHTRPAVPGCGWVESVSVSPGMFDRADVRNARNNRAGNKITLAEFDTAREVLADEEVFFRSLARDAESHPSEEAGLNRLIELQNRGYTTCGNQTVEIYPLYAVKSENAVYATGGDSINAKEWAAEKYLGDETIATIGTVQDQGKRTGDPNHIYKETDGNLALMRGSSFAHFDVYDRMSKTVIKISEDGNCFWYSLSHIVFKGDESRWQELKDAWLSYMFRVDSNTTQEHFERLAGCFFEYSVFDDELGGLLEGYKLAQLLIEMKTARDAVDSTNSRHGADGL